MKIIKQGHEEDRMQVICPKCEAVLEITSDDIYHESTSETIWGIDYYTCPCCNSKRVLEKHEMTIGVSVSLRR